MDVILTVNAGSSSLKFQVFGTSGANGLNRLIRGQVDGVGTAPRMRAKGADGDLLVDQEYGPGEVADLASAIRIAGAWLRERQGMQLAAVGHRVVHGGPDYARPVRVSAEVLQRLERYIPLAPLHQANNLAPINEVLTLRPDLPQVACFDTAFHRNHSAVADYYAIPRHLHDEGIRRYGFHGLSYEFISTRLRDVAPGIANGRIIVAHLGSGASMCALSGGRSVDSTMGFTALDGLPMGTRCGQIDPGVVLYLLQAKGMTATEVQDLLYRDSGLEGLSGISNDMRELQDSTDPRAAFAVDYFVHRIGLHAGMLAAALGGLDRFVFTAGIGENSPTIRARVAEKLAWLGARLDVQANAAPDLLISTDESGVPLLVIPTDEELMIARHTVEVIRGTAH